VGVEQAGLGRDGLHDARVAVPHRGDVVVAIEEASPFRVEEPDPFTAHEMDGLVVEELVGGSEGPTSALQKLAFVHGSHSWLGRWSSELVASSRIRISPAFRRSMMLRDGIPASFESVYDRVDPN
jgi:hypothetical protein